MSDRSVTSNEMNGAPRLREFGHHDKFGYPMTTLYVRYDEHERLRAAAITACSAMGCFCVGDREDIPPGKRCEMCKLGALLSDDSPPAPDSSARKVHRPCPFCGGMDIRSRTIGEVSPRWILSCADCPCEIGPALLHTLEDAWACWDRRSSPDETSAWRPIDELEPTAEPPTFVIIAERKPDGTYVVGEARWFKEGWRWAGNDPTDHWGREVYPTHWMPWPAPPSVVETAKDEVKP